MYSNALITTVKLGNQPGNVLLSMGAVAFDDPSELTRDIEPRYDGRVFLSRICIRSSISAGFKIDGEALINWQNKPEKEWNTAFGGQTPIDMACNRLVTWKDRNLSPRATIWIDSQCDLPAMSFALEHMTPFAADLLADAGDIRDILECNEIKAKADLSCPLEKCRVIGEVLVKRPDSHLETLFSPAHEQLTAACA